MDANSQSLKTAQWLEAMERGELTPDQVRARLIDAGADPAEADEIVGIAQGESDLVIVTDPEAR